MSIVTVNDLTVSFGNHLVINNLNFSINQGDFLVVIGENGVGKTTLVRSLLGFIKPQKGKIIINSTNKDWLCSPVSQY